MNAPTESKPTDRIAVPRGQGGRRLREEDTRFNVKGDASRRKAIR